MKLNNIYFALMATLALVACNNTPDDNPVNEGENKEELVLPDGTIVLNNCAGGIYFGDFWDEGIGDYYFLLSNDTSFGQTEHGFDVPMTPGRWLLYIDVWGALSEDHTNPIVPEGTYTWGEKRGPNVLTSSYTVATENVEKVGDLYRIVDHYFQDGTVVVKHTDKGYKIDASFITVDGEPMKFTFEGEMTLEDKSDDEEYNPELDGDVVIEPVIASSFFYESYENCDNHVLMLFTSDNLNYDKTHINEPGLKLHLDLYNTPGAGLAGHYVAGEVNEVGILTKEAGVFYPGRMYSATIALGTILERVNDDEEMSVEYAVIVDGTIDITDNGDGTHTVVADLTTGNDGKVSCNWTGVIAPHGQ